MTTLVREPSKQAPGIDQFARKALVGIVVAALIHPAYFTFTRTGGAMYGYSGILAASLSLMALGAMALKSSLVPPSFLLIAASCSIYYLASLLAGKPLQDPSELISILGLSALMIIAWKHSPDTLLQPICIVLGTYLIINFVTIVTHPAGLYFAYYADTKNGIANWFLGYKNPLIRLAIPTLALWYLRDTLIFGVIRARSKLLTVLVLVSVIRVNSTNGVVALLLFVLLTYALVSRKSALPARLRIYMATSAVFFVLIVILRVQNLFSWLLVDYLHKDLTLVGRTYIWDAALTNFFDSPWIGTGSTSLQISASGAYGPDCCAGAAGSPVRRPRTRGTGTRPRPEPCTRRRSGARSAGS